MRFVTHEEVGLLADTIDERYRALVLVLRTPGSERASWSGCAAATSVSCVGL